jgi:hypothetical protein
MPWLRPSKQEGHTVVTSLQTGGPYRGYVPTNRRAMPWLRPYKQEGHTVVASLQTGGPYCGYVPTNRRDILWLSRSVSGLSPLMPGFDPRLVYMGFIVNKLVLSIFSK